VQQFVAYLKCDESCHIACAVYVLSRSVAQCGDVAWNAIEERMNELLPYVALAVALLLDPLPR